MLTLLLTPVLPEPALLVPVLPWPLLNSPLLPCRGEEQQLEGWLTLATSKCVPGQHCHSRPPCQYNTHTHLALIACSAVALTLVLGPNVAITLIFEPLVAITNVEIADISIACIREPGRAV